ncbi:HNH endonuclease [Archangium lansingense]|uniref:HNH endonuclease n=1 Tax=Archangium lansingense TaxID=2995310 RepID=A0ABT3ZXI7_9BACT|nr:hypothetical protein [Archangium lansinium]MCY1074112.1 hypothetical protein [Archangium lansinium]
MKSAQPVPYDDQSTISKICKDRAGWSVHETSWIQSVVAYKAAQGDPWVLQPNASLKIIAEKLENLYESRHDSKYIKDARDIFTGCCPMCGSLSTGTLDHYLPKDEYPEFSIFSLNLIPACSHCNSSQKGTVFKGAKAPERFIHPYFDNFLNKPLWLVALKEPYNAVKIGAIPDPGLSGNELEIVRFHITRLLGNEFKKHARSLWTNLPQTVAKLLLEAKKGASVATINEIKNQIQWLMTAGQFSYGLNSWTVGIYRGILADPKALDYLTKQVGVVLTTV